MNLLLKILWTLHEHYNYLQMMQIGNYLRKLLKDLNIVWLGLG
jgi:hypothetical protein